MLSTRQSKTDSESSPHSCSVFEDCSAVFEKLNEAITLYSADPYDMFDSILAVALSYNSSKTIQNLSYTGLTGTITIENGLRLINISINQLVNSSFQEISRYISGKSQLKTLYALSETNNFPQGKTRIVEYRTFKASIVLVSLLFVVILLFLTISLVLYFYFRNEPEVKATSVSVSMCMYLGCYLTLLFVPFLLLDSQPASIVGTAAANFTCHVLL